MCMYLKVAELLVWYFFFFRQKTAYEMRIIYWSSDLCSSDLVDRAPAGRAVSLAGEAGQRTGSRDRGVGRVRPRRHRRGFLSRGGTCWQATPEAVNASSPGALLRFDIPCLDPNA